MQKRLNIIIIIVDDLGYGDVGFQEFCTKDVQTPNIDRIAASGCVFDTAYSTSPICSPSRTGIITGRYQQRWGNYWFGQGGLPSCEVTIPGILRQHGYKTMKIGKTHHNGGDAEHPLDHGFDEFYGFVDHTADYNRQTKEDLEHYGQINSTKAHIGILMRNRERVYDRGYTTDMFTDEAVEYINSASNEVPFYMEVAYNAVHQPIYVNHPMYLEKFGLEPFPQWEPDVEDYNTWHAKWGTRGNVDPDGRIRYLSTLSVLDDGIGRILDNLESKGIANDTMLVFLSDNGGAYENYACNAMLKAGKYTLFEGGIRVPLVISCPVNCASWQRNSLTPVSTMDIFPTILDVVGIDQPANLDGCSLLPIMKGKTLTTLHPFLAWDNGIMGKHGHEYAVRQGDWKIVKTVLDERKAIRLNTLCVEYNKHCWNTKTVMGINFFDMDWMEHNGLRLYNLKDDISETEDLSVKYPDIVRDLKNTYKMWHSEMK